MHAVLPLKVSINSDIFTQSILALIFSISPSEINSEWEMKFHKISDPLVNPVLGPIEETTFTCPVRRKQVNWEAKDVFNPAAVVKDGKVYLLYRAEDRVRELIVQTSL
jgi:beta-1,2-mannosidase